MTPLDIALKWARLGYRVFPSKSSDDPQIRKRPLKSGWREEASCLEVEVRADFEGMPDNTNVLMVAPTDLCVVDLDVKNEAQDGVENWRQLCEEHGITPFGETFTVQTASGGIHAYYKTDKPTHISNSMIAPGIDTRTTDGLADGTKKYSYVVSPDNPGYTVMMDKPIAMLPEFVYEGMKSMVRGTKMEYSIAEYEWKEDRKEVARILEPIMEEPYRDGVRNDMIHSHARKAYLQGVHPDVFQEFVHTKLDADGWGNQTTEEIWRTIDSAYKSCNEPPGHYADERANSLAAIAGLDPDAPPVPSRFKHLTFADMKAQEPPRWLVKGMIPQASLGVLVAPSGSKKTFAALDLAMTMATDGDEWNGRKLHGNKVLFAAGEGARGIYRRMVGWMKHNSVNDVGDGLRLVDTVPTHEVHELAEFISQDDEWVPDLVVIDTISYASLGLEENSASDMMQLIANYRLAIHGKWPEATVLFIGHARKDAKGGDGTKLRGSGAVYGAADFMLGLEEQDQAIVLRTTKIKDGAAIGERMAFRAKEIEIGRDEDDDPVTTLVMPWCDVPIDEDKLPNPSTMSWETMDRTQQVRAAAFVALSNIEPNTTMGFKELATEVKHMFITRQGQNPDMTVEEAEMSLRVRALRKILAPRTRTAEDALFIEPRLAVEADTAPGLVFAAMPGRSMYDALFEVPRADEE